MDSESKLKRLCCAKRMAAGARALILLGALAFLFVWQTGAILWVIAIGMDHEAQTLRSSMEG